MRSVIILAGGLAVLGLARGVAVLCGTCGGNCWRKSSPVWLAAALINMDRSVAGRIFVAGEPSIFPAMSFAILPLPQRSSGGSFRDRGSSRRAPQTRQR
jgi:hypothetical protein